MACTKAVSFLHDICIKSTDIQQLCAAAGAGSTIKHQAHGLPANFDDFLIKLPPAGDITSQLLFRKYEPSLVQWLSVAYSSAGEAMRSVYQDRIRTLASIFPEDFHSSDGVRLLRHRQELVSKRYERALQGWRKRIFSWKHTDDEITKLWSKPNNPFNHQYLPVLETAFYRNPFPSHSDKTNLAKKTSMTYRQIHVWFQNKRNRLRRDGMKMRSTSANQMFPKHLAVSKIETVSSENLTCQHSEKREESDGSAADSLCELNNSLPRHVLDQPAPSHAFPSPYPPSCSYNPFPSKPVFTACDWRRYPDQTHSHEAYHVDVSDLAEKFHMLSVREDSPRRVLKRKCFFDIQESAASKKPHIFSAESSSAAATSAITTKPQSAPLPAFVPSKAMCPATRIPLLPTIRAPSSKRHAFDNSCPIVHMVTLIPPPPSTNAPARLGETTYSSKRAPVTFPTFSNSTHADHGFSKSLSTDLLTRCPKSRVSSFGSECSPEYPFLSPSPSSVTSTPASSTPASPTTQSPSAAVLGLRPKNSLDAFDPNSLPPVIVL